MPDNNTTGDANGLGGGVVASSGAETSLAALTPEERNRIIQAARNLAGRKPWEWSGVYVISMPGVKDQYYLLVVSPEWRAIIRQLEGGEIEISDVVRAETLQLFRERLQAGGAPK
jgi:hypothetical protein